MALTNDNKIIFVRDTRAFFIVNIEMLHNIYGIKFINQSDIFELQNFKKKYTHKLIVIFFYFERFRFISKLD